MPTNKLIGTQLDPGQLGSCINQLTVVQSILTNYSQNLTPEERQRFGRINETNKLLVNKVRDYYKTNSSLSSQDVNWVEFEESWQSRTGFEILESLCSAIIEICSDARILHDYYLYQNALVDYNYTKYKAESASGAGGYSTKADEMKQLFPNPSGKNGVEDTPAS